MTWDVLTGDCVAVMATLPESSIDCIVTDPPYDLVSVTERLTKNPGADGQYGKSGIYARHTRGFMGQAWDGTGVAFKVETWAAALRVLKPGGHLLAFGGTRTFHRMTVAIEDAGFEIRDCLSWNYGTGFPKSLDISKDARFCQCSTVQYSHEESRTRNDMLDMRNAIPSSAKSSESRERSDVFASMQRQDASQEPDQVLRGQLETRQRRATRRTKSQDDGRAESGLEGRRNLPQETRELHGSPLHPDAGMGATDGASGRLRDGTSPIYGDLDRPAAEPDRSRTSQGPQSRKQRPSEPRTMADEREPQSSGTWPNCDRCSKPIGPKGLGTALKPAWEPIILARKPFAGSVAKNVERYGTGGLNIDASRIQGGAIEQHAKPGASFQPGTFGGFTTSTPKNPKQQERAEQGLNPRYDEGGRWPANVILDPDAAAELDRQSGETASKGVQHSVNRGSNNQVYGAGVGGIMNPNNTHDTGGASRFFFIAKPSTEERNRSIVPGDKSTHPTVKPIALLVHLIGLVCPENGTVLDPFLGSGTTAIAALRLGRNVIGIEQSEEYADLARRRIQGDAPLFNLEGDRE